MSSFPTDAIVPVFFALGLPLLLAEMVVVGRKGASAWPIRLCAFLLGLMFPGMFFLFGAVIEEPGDLAPWLSGLAVLLVTAGIALLALWAVRRRTSRAAAIVAPSMYTALGLGCVIGWFGAETDDSGTWVIILVPAAAWSIIWSLMTAALTVAVADGRRSRTKAVPAEA